MRKLMLEAVGSVEAVGTAEAGGAELRTKPAPKIVRKIYEPMRLCKMF